MVVAVCATPDAVSIAPGVARGSPVQGWSSTSGPWLVTIIRIIGAAFPLGCAALAACRVGALDGAIALGMSGLAISELVQLPSET